MRSRYCAYALGLAGYLVETHHPSTRGNRLKAKLEPYLPQVEWTGLKVINTQLGGAKDKIGKVEFIATSLHNNHANEMHEHSRFRRYQGKWMYFDDKG